MRHATLLLPALLTALAFAGCGEDDCTDGQVRPCYTGPAGTSGRGLCRDGVQQCSGGRWQGECLGEVVPSDELCDQVDNDCDGEVDEDVQNPCGGCARLPGEPGGACQGCGSWSCDGPDALVCNPPDNVPGTPCQGDTCEGLWKCNSDGSVTCATPRVNECGVCGGMAVDGIGDPCMGAGGCEGTLVCNVSGSNSFCEAPSPNNCGACGKPNVPGVGNACTTPDGCTGTLECNEQGTGTVCIGPNTNACGVWNGPEIVGLGDPCGEGECAGTLVCNAAGTGTVCRFPGEGETCSVEEGECPGVLRCAASGNTTECVAPEKNECGLCAGPPVTGLGEACSNSAGCEGVLECNVDGDGTVCQLSQACLPQTNHVVISELAGRGPRGQEDEFIELYNPTDAEVSLNGWSLWYKSETGNSGQFLEIVKLGSGNRIAPRGYFLLGRRASGGYAGPAADAEWRNQALGGDGGHVFLVRNSTKPKSPSDTNIVDAVGWGSKANFPEGKSVPTPGQFGSIERKAHAGATAASMSPGGEDEHLGNSLDTDDNRNDFVLRSVRDPQNSSSPTEPASP